MIKQTFQLKAVDLDLYKISMDNKEQDALLVTVEGQDNTYLLLSNAFLTQFREDNYQFVQYRLQPEWGDLLTKPGQEAGVHKAILIRSDQVTGTVKQLERARKYLEERKWVNVYTLDKKLEQKALYRFQVNRYAEIDLLRISRENECVDILIVAYSIPTPGMFLMLSNTFLKTMSEVKYKTIWKQHVDEDWGYEYVGAIGENFTLTNKESPVTIPIAYHRALHNDPANVEHVTVQIRHVIREYWNTAEVTVKVHTL